MIVLSIPKPTETIDSNHFDFYLTSSEFSISTISSDRSIEQSNLFEVWHLVGFDPFAVVQFLVATYAGCRFGTCSQSADSP